MKQPRAADMSYNDVQNQTFSRLKKVNTNKSFYYYYYFVNVYCNRTSSLLRNWPRAYLGPKEKKLLGPRIQKNYSPLKTQQRQMNCLIAFKGLMLPPLLLLLTTSQHSGLQIFKYNMAILKKSHIYSFPIH